MLSISVHKEASTLKKALPSPSRTLATLGFTGVFHLATSIFIRLADRQPCKPEKMTQVEKDGMGPMAMVTAVTIAKAVPGSPIGGKNMCSRTCLNKRY